MIALKRLSLSLLACLLVPALVELAIHLIGDPRVAAIDAQLDRQPAYWQLAKQGFYELADEGQRFRMKPGFRGSVKGVDYRINALGLRGGEITAKAAGARRVLLLGDSYAFGLGVSEGEAISAQLEALLREAAGGGDAIEVINAGVPAYQTEQERLLLERTGFALQPDLVVLLWFANDNVAAPLTYAPTLHVLWHDDLPVPYSWKAPLSRSFLWSLLAKIDAGRRLERGEYDTSGAGGERNWTTSAARIDAIARACAERGARFLIAAIPDLESSVALRDEAGDAAKDQARLVAFAQQRGHAVIDLRPTLLTKVKAVEKLFLSLDPLDPHFNARGCRLVAEAIAPAAAALLAAKPVDAPPR